MAWNRTPRERWIEEGLALLADGGPDAVRVEALARRLGVTKGGFYGYFADRAALLTELLDTWERRSTDEVVDRAERDGGDAAERGRRAAELTFSPALLPVDLAVRDWARRDPAVAGRLRRVDDFRMGYLRDLLSPVSADADDLEQRCLIAFAVAIADHSIVAGHGDRTRAEVVDGITRRLFSPGDAG